MEDGRRCRPYSELSFGTCAPFLECAPKMHQQPCQNMRHTNCSPRTQIHIGGDREPKETWNIILVTWRFGEGNWKTKGDTDGVRSQVEGCDFGTKSRCQSLKLLMLMLLENRVVFSL